MLQISHMLQTSSFNQPHVLVASNSISLFCIDKYSPARWVSRKLRPKSRTFPCYTADCFKSSCLHFVVYTMSCMWMCLVLQRDSQFVSLNCHATDIALTKQLDSSADKFVVITQTKHDSNAVYFFPDPTNVGFFFFHFLSPSLSRSYLYQNLDKR